MANCSHIEPENNLLIFNVNQYLFFKNVDFSVQNIRIQSKWSESSFRELESWGLDDSLNVFCDPMALNLSRLKRMHKIFNQLLEREVSNFPWKHRTYFMKCYSKLHMKQALLIRLVVSSDLNFKHFRKLSVEC